MNIKKKYSITNKRIIWRLIPSGNKLLIEERDANNKQVYFNCIDIDSGNSVLSDFQLEEKFWVGIEAFENDKIFFHKYDKPDMPGHIGITVYNLITNEILWSRKDLIFLFLYENQVFAYIQKFESRDFFSLDAVTGNIIKDYGEDVRMINGLREKLLAEQYEKYKNYLFPESYAAGKLSTESQNLVENLKENEIISGGIEFIKYKNLLLLSFHTVKDNGLLNNSFRIIDIGSGKIIFEDVVNTGITSYIPDTFFIKDNFLFLINDKTKLVVFSLIGD